MEEDGAGSDTELTELYGGIKKKRGPEDFGAGRLIKYMEDWEAAKRQEDEEYLEKLKLEVAPEIYQTVLEDYQKE